MLSAAIVGARGYLGRECVRLLLGHPHVGDVVPISLSSPEGTLADTVPAFRGLPGLEMRAVDHPAVQEADVVFFATSGGDAKALAPKFSDDQVLIDLSRDHRLDALKAQAMLLSSGETVEAGTQGTAGTWSFGLCESPLAIEEGTTRIANPGCYPTSALLGMAPALTHGLVASGPVIVDGKSGVSGAGATPRPDLHFPEANDDVRAYKVVGHDHGDEMRHGAGRMAGQSPEGRPVRFTPHLIPVTRGLLTTTYLPLAAGVGEEDVAEAYRSAYADAPTVRLSDEARIGNVRNTALAEIAWTIDPECQMLIVRSAIDNLLKGGSGQAIQNMNRTFGYQETTGLPLIAGP